MLSYIKRALRERYASIKHRGRKNAGGFMQLEEFRPRPALVTKVTRVDRPKFPVFDAHNHLGDTFGGGWIHRTLPQILDAMDEAGVTHLLDLDGGWGEDIVREHAAKLKTGSSAERFFISGGVDWSKWPEHGNRFGEWAADRLREQVGMGIQSLKIWKPLGLHVRDQNNTLVKVDDPRLDAVWAAAGELDLPVTIHVADPVAFFDPLDNTNERWEELHAQPDWQFPSPPFPPFLEIVNGMANVVAHHPETTFIGAHVGCYAENLAWVGDLLDRCPNFYVDFSARLGELGRQPYAARRFFQKYADRIVFGIDVGIDLETYRLTYRFLESDDEYFNYNTGEIPNQGRWHVSGLYLPDDVLEKVYHLNAEKIFGVKDEE
jgi:hypothetical protein